MKTIQLMLKQMMKFGLLLMMGASMSALAGLFGFGGHKLERRSAVA